MAGEIAPLSGSMDLEPTAPVPSVPSPQGQSTRENPEGKSGRRPPLEEQVSAWPVEPDSTDQDPVDPDNDSAQHQIDSLA